MARKDEVRLTKVRSLDRLVDQDERGGTDRLDSQEVINPVKLVLSPSSLRDRLHHLFSTFQILSERLLDNDSTRKNLLVLVLLGGFVILCQFLS
jgi:hypothetical protein